MHEICGNSQESSEIVKHCFSGISYQHFELTIPPEQFFPHPS
jgi:hypothetical protein